MPARFRIKKHIIGMCISAVVSGLLLFFLVIFLIFGIQIFQSKRTLADINGNIRQAQSQLTKQKQKNQQLQRQIKMLHNPEYIQQVIRAKYNYSKKGEIIYNLN